MKSRIGQEIERLLVEKGMQQVELARKMGITPQGISQMKRSRKLYWDNMNRLEKALGVESGHFFRFRG